MLLDGIKYGEYADRSDDTKLRRIRPFIELVERKLGVSVIYGQAAPGATDPDLIRPMRLAESFLETGVIRSFRRGNRPPDEPPLYYWSAVCGDEKNAPAGGASSESDEAALTAALAESLERYVWLTQTDYFQKPTVAKTREMPQKRFISPEKFVSFSKEERERDPRRNLDEDASYLWIQGLSLVSGKRVYVPAQIASAQHARNILSEPLIRQSTTIGLATWPTLAGARVAGALEVIEREAYMIMWYNQLSLPRIKLSSLEGKSNSLDRLLERCGRYRLKVHAIRMLSDAPAHAICVVVEDVSGSKPRYAVGLKAHRTITWAVEKALTEALRARIGGRFGIQGESPWDPSLPVDKIGHRNRIEYWADKENARHLDFLVAGKEEEHDTMPWENDSAEEHLSRIVAWCREKDLECISVSMGGSRANVTPWHIEMVIMPDLQPTHLTERMRQSAGERLKTVPLQFGYTPREKPFIERPHPYS